MKIFNLCRPIRFMLCQVFFRAFLSYKKTKKVWERGWYAYAITVIMPFRKPFKSPANKVCMFCWAKKLALAGRRSVCIENSRKQLIHFVPRYLELMCKKVYFKKFQHNAYFSLISAYLTPVIVTFNFVFNFFPLKFEISSELKWKTIAKKTILPILRGLTP